MKPTDCTVGKSWFALNAIFDKDTIQPVQLPW